MPPRVLRRRLRDECSRSVLYQFTQAAQIIAQAALAVDPVSGGSVSHRLLSRVKCAAG
jgi:hypothetical protein